MPLLAPSKPPAVLREYPRVVAGLDQTAQRVLLSFGPWLPPSRLPTGFVYKPITWRGQMSYRLLSIVLLPLLTSGAMAQDGPDRIRGVHYFRVDVHGGISKTLNDMGRFLKPLSEAACEHFYGQKCPEALLWAGAPIPMLLAKGYVNTEDTQQGALRAPNGYQYCKVQVNGNGSISGEATFTGTLQDDRQQLAFYMFARQGGGVGPAGNWAKFNVYYELWKKGTGAAPPQCMTDGPVFECGQKTNLTESEGRS
jgi:hypothetical protein